MSITLFNDGWQFAKHKPENWTQVTLPHDWLIYDTKNLYETSIGWYKKELDGSVFNLGQRVILRFDGVYMDSTLFVNGKNAGEWKYGYTAFEHDITDFLNANGVNELLLKVDYKSPNSRWYSGAGIYRDVFLKIKNSAHFVSDGIYVTPKKLDETRWQVEVDAEINVATKDTDYEIRHTINGKEWITLKGTGSGTANLTDNNSLIVENPQLWDIESPNLYTLKSELLINGEIMDECETRFGFRELSFTSNDGFFLNSKPVRLNGVCLHHDLGSLGAAVDKNAIKRQLLILRKMGVNAIRTSHNPPAAAFMELTDEMGFLVMSELLDMWELPKTEYDYARFLTLGLKKTQLHG
ncbi:beta-galactosidase [Holotrichia oblita]|nr:beta-galactosidase [Holotrichia oblita]